MCPRYDVAGRLPGDLGTLVSAQDALMLVCSSRPPRGAVALLALAVLFARIAHRRPRGASQDPKLQGEMT